MLKRWVCGAGLVLLALTIAGCAGLAGEPAIVGSIPATATTVARPVSLPQTPPDLALGASIYAANCTRCHGAAGKGDGEFVQSGQVPAPPDFTDPQTSRDAAPIAWFEVVTNGRLDKLMPPWGDSLSEAERWSVTHYVYTLANTDEQIAQGQAVWAQKCAECHGERGEGTLKGAPLPDLLAISTNDALAAVADGIQDRMPPMAADIPPDQREAVIAYARTLREAGQPVEVAQVPTQAATEAAPVATEMAHAATEAVVDATEAAVIPPLATQEVVAPSSTQEVAPAASGELVQGELVRPGTVTGAVTNGTAGGVVPEDLAVNLHVISEDGQTAAQTFETRVSADSRYTFADVPFAAGSQYVVTALYGGAAFSSDLVAGDPASPQLDLPLSIYEVTDDPADISINGVLMMLQNEAQPGLLEVVQIVSFTNASDRVFLRQGGDVSASVSVRLPAGASYEDFSGGGYRVSADGSEISDTNAVLPGDAHVMHVAYSVPYSGSISLAQPLDYPLNGDVEILVPSGALTVSGSEISTLGTRQMGSRSFTSFGGTYNRSAGDSLRYDVSSAAAQATSVAPTGINVAAYVLIGVGLLAIGAAFGFFMRERTSAASVSTSSSASANPAASAKTTREINALVKQIADLDMRYEARKISTADYNHKRRKLKEQLTERMKAQAQDESTDN